MAKQNERTNERARARGPCQIMTMSRGKLGVCSSQNKKHKKERRSMTQLVSSRVIKSEERPPRASREEFHVGNEKPNIQVYVSSVQCCTLIVERNRVVNYRELIPRKSAAESTYQSSLRCICLCTTQLRLPAGNGYRRDGRPSRPELNPLSSRRNLDSAPAARLPGKTRKSRPTT